MIRIGVIGAGGISGAHIPHYAGLADAQMVALCDIQADRASGKAAGIAINMGTLGGTAVQARPYTDYHALLADPEVDAVDICLPTFLHAEVAVAALQAGKHVLCEKPMALTVADCDRMIAAAEAADRVLMVAHCIRFWPEYLALKALVESGTYGRVCGAIFHRLSALPDWTWEHWIINPARSGGAILDLHIHDADFIAYLFGMPKSVTAVGVEDEHGISQVTAFFQYEPNQSIVAEGGWYYYAGFPFRSTFRVQLEGATVELDGARGPLTVYPSGGTPFTPEFEPGDAYQREIAYFVECIRTGRKPEITTPFSSRESIRLIHAEMEAVRTGRTVAL